MSGARCLKVLFTGCAVLMVLTLALAREDHPGKPRKSTTGAVLRSLAFPGWGQCYTENYWKAAGFTVAQGSFIASIWWNQNRINDNMDSHNFDLERFHRDQRNKMIWWLVGFTLLSMGDSYVNAHLYGLDWSPEISVTDRSVSAGMTVAVRF